MRLKGRVAIITGSATGLGRVFAQRLAKEGARVVVCDIADSTDTAKAIKLAGGEALILKTDVSNAEITIEMAKQTWTQFRHIDILVNNAAVYAGLKPKPYYEIKEEEWNKVMAVNVKGTWLCCKAVFPYMKKQEKGKIINISSRVHFTGQTLFLHYATSKGAIVALTRALAREMGEYNINVNAVAPGITMTEATLSGTPRERIEQIVSSQSIKRPEQPTDLEGVLVFLASEDSDFITGQTFVVDGGGYMH